MHYLQNVLRQFGICLASVSWQLNLISHTLTIRMFEHYSGLTELEWPSHRYGRKAMDIQREDAMESFFMVPQLLLISEPTQIHLWLPDLCFDH